MTDSIEQAVANMTPEQRRMIAKALAKQMASSFTGNRKEAEPDDEQAEAPKSRERTVSVEVPGGLHRLAMARRGHRKIAVFGMHTMVTDGYSLVIRNGDVVDPVYDHKMRTVEAEGISSKPLALKAKARVSLPEHESDENFAKQTDPLRFIRDEAFALDKGKHIQVNVNRLKRVAEALGSESLVIYMHGDPDKDMVLVQSVLGPNVPTNFAVMTANRSMPQEYKNALIGALKLAIQDLTDGAPPNHESATERLSESS